jgi:hypothetical protein
LRATGVDELGVDRLGVLDGVREAGAGAEATGVVSAGFFATGVALWQAAVESSVANPNRANVAFFIFPLCFSESVYITPKIGQVPQSPADGILFARWSDTLEMQG